MKLKYKLLILFSLILLITLIIIFTTKSSPPSCSNCSPSCLSGKCVKSYDKCVKGVCKCSKTECVKCGDDDGCGGKCQIGQCPNTSFCLKGVCKPSTNQKQIFKKVTDTVNCVYEFYDTDDINKIKTTIENFANSNGTVWPQQGSIAFLFHPGTYDFNNWYMNIPVQTSVRGLGILPSNTIFKNCKIGVSHCSTVCPSPATNIFWRDLENIQLEHDIDWCSSQECPIRRVITSGNIILDQGHYMWASGGFISNTKSKSIVAFNQQQFCVKNIDSKVTPTGMNWVYINSNTNVKNSCEGGHANVITNDHIVYDKPYLVDGGSILVPTSFTTNGVNFSTSSNRIDFTELYIVYPNDTVDNINKQLETKIGLLFTSGLYTFNDSIQIKNDNIVILGIGWPVIQGGTNTNPVFDISGENCILAGLMVDAGNGNPNSLIWFHEKTNGKMFDICCRILKPDSGKNSCKSMVTIDQDDFYGENIWLWRADHQKEGANDTNAKWDMMDNPNGIIINGNKVRMFGLAVEHQSSVMTQWNGDKGECYFYQSEFAYGGMFDNSASYVVNDKVNNHILKGGGAYFVVDYFTRGGLKAPDIEAAFVCPDNNVELKPIIWAGTAWGCCTSYIKNTLKRGNRLLGKIDNMIC